MAIRQREEIRRAQMILLNQTLKINEAKNGLVSLWFGLRVKRSSYISIDSAETAPRDFHLDELDESTVSGNKLYKSTVSGTTWMNPQSLEPPG